MSLLDTSLPAEAPVPLRDRLLAVLPWLPFGLAAIPVGIVAACQWRAAQESHTRAALIRDLVNQGLTASEVERLAVDPARAREQEQAAYYKVQVLAVEDDLRRDLAARGLSADDVQLVLRAWSNPVASSGRYSYDTLNVARKEAEWVKGELNRGRPAKEVAAMLRTPLREEARGGGAGGPTTGEVAAVLPTPPREGGPANEHAGARSRAE